MELKICHLYPDVMNLSCDRGNLICMEKRLQWRGIAVEIVPAPMGEALPEDCDLYFVGNGIPYQPQLLEDLRRHKADRLLSDGEAGVPVLAIDGGFELLGKTITAPDGTVSQGLGLLDMTTVYKTGRLVGNCAFICEDPQTTVVGFENHAGYTTLGTAVRPLGRITAGHGNNGSDGTEGARYKNVFGSYAHGSLLPKNPALCDLILKLALDRKYGTADLAPLDDTMEENAHGYMVGRLCK